MNMPRRMPFTNHLHHCSKCWGPIDPGTLYISIPSSFDNNFYHVPCRP